MKTLLRVIVGAMIALAAYQSVMGAIGLVGALSASAVNAGTFSERVGFLTGTLLMLVGFVWLFRKLGTAPRGQS